MKNWDDYKLVLALKRTGTIRQAANIIGVNHATVSRRLVQINNDYDMPVFERVSGGYKTTPLGVELVNAAERIEAISLITERKSRSVEKSLSGSIRLSLSEPIAQFLLQEALAEFIQTHPQIDLVIETSIGLVNLDRSEADIVVRGTSAPPSHLVGRRLFPFSLCLYCKTDYLQTTAPEERRWLRFTKSVIKRDWIAASPYPNIPIGLRSDDLMFLLNAAKSGHGLLNTACYMADQQIDLIRLPDVVPEIAQDLWVLTHPDLRETPRIKALMKHISEALIKKRDLIEGRLYSKTS